MSKNSILSLDEIRERIEDLEAFDVNDYIISTKDGKHSLDLKAAMGNGSVKMFFANSESGMIRIDFHNGQSVSLNEQKDDWFVEDKRARSVYLISDSNGAIKIGISVHVEKRFTQIQNSSSVPLTLLHHKHCKNARDVEMLIHLRYKDKRLNGEWFNLSDSDVQDIKDFLNGVDT